MDRVLVLHEGRDWGRAVQRLMDSDGSVFPYDEVHHLGTSRLVSLSPGWEFVGVYSEEGSLVWPAGELSSSEVLGSLNPSLYCSWFESYKY